MKTITNNGRRRLGIPGRPALLLEPGESKPVSEDQLEVITKNQIVSRWIDSGMVSISGQKVKEPEPEKPEVPTGVTGEGAEVVHVGGGWYQVKVAGISVTDDNVRKAKAEEIAAEYD